MDDNTQIELVRIWQRVQSGRFDESIVVDMFTRIRELVDRSKNKNSKVLEIGDFLAHWQERNRGYWSNELTDTVKQIHKKGRARKLRYKPWTDLQVLKELNEYFGRAGVEISENWAATLCALLFPKLLDTHIRLRNQQEVVLGIHYDQNGTLSLCALFELNGNVFALPIVSASCKLFAKQQTEADLRFRALPTFDTKHPSVGLRTKLGLELVNGRIFASQEGRLIRMDVGVGDHSEENTEHAIPAIPYQRMLRVLESNGDSSKD